MASPTERLIGFYFAHKAEIDAVKDSQYAKALIEEFKDPKFQEKAKTFLKLTKGLWEDQQTQALWNDIRTEMGWSKDDTLFVAKTGGAQ